MRIARWPNSFDVRPKSGGSPSVRTVGRLALLLLPAALLLGGIFRTFSAGHVESTLVVGLCFQILLCSFCLGSRSGRRQSSGSSALLLYVTGLGWLWLSEHMANRDDWYIHLAQAVLLIVSLLVFAFQVLVDSGAPEWRRAQMLARRLTERNDWPADLSACRALPEVKAFREALHVDAAPALFLLGHPRPQVRLAALAALEFRQHWRPGQAAMIVQAARQMPEPALRATAVTALANVDDRLVVEQLAEFLHDSALEVRRAASEALLWDTGTRWPWIRHAVRRALATSAHLEDGPLTANGQLLTPDAVKDLTAWAAEKGFLAVRAALTLGAHYERALTEQPDELLIADLRRCLADPHAPPALRMELAHLLQDHRLLDRELLEGLLDPLNPAPLRLLAADALLGQGQHLGAVAGLHDVARLPNREIALATAGVVQRRLGIDLGLPLGQSIPPVHSRLAAEITRRVMRWAIQEAAADPVGAK